MRQTLTISASLLLLAASACSGNSATGGNGGGGSTSSGTTTTTSSATGSSTTSGMGTGGATGDTVTITMDEFTVDPGQEVYKCQNFANPFGGADVDVSMFESHMSAGSHHLLVFFKPGATDGALQSCSGLEFAATPYGSQSPDDSLSFPPGVAELISHTDGLRFQSHYLNTTASTITAHVEVTFHLAAPGTVTDHAGVLFAVDTKINVMPSSTATDIADCTIPVDMNVIRAQSHMHKHGQSFVATVAGNPVYQTTEWSDPKPGLFTPPMAFKAGDPLHWACTFQNDGATTLTFGESAQTNEMCIFTAVFYPTPAGQPTIAPNNCVTMQQ